MKQALTRVRPAEAADIAFCQSMDKNLHHLPKYGANVEMLMRMKAILIAEYEGRSAGYLRMEHIFPEIPYISWINVLPELRQRGIGKDMTNCGVRAVFSVADQATNF